MISAEMRSTIEFLIEHKSSLAYVSVKKTRDAMRQMQLELSVPPSLEIEFVHIPGDEETIAGRWHLMPGSRKDRVILYLHGGAYVFGNLDTHQEFMARLAQIATARVLGIHYRLAPEHTFPAALDDARAAYFWLLEQGIPAHQIAVAGDSSGGGLALALLMSLRQSTGEEPSKQALPQPGCALLFSPWADLTLTGKEVLEKAETDPLADIPGFRKMAGYYGGKTAMDNPLISPVYGEFSGLPPMVVQAGDRDILMADSVRLKDLADNAGVILELQIFEGGFHAFQTFSVVPEAQAAINKAVLFFNQHIKS